MNNLTKALTALFFCMGISTTNAQTLLKGKVLDSENGDAMIKSTVMVMNADTTRMVAGGTTDDNGAFNIKNVKDGTYVVKVSYIGYRDFYKKITVNKKETQGSMAVGTVMLTPGNIELKQAVVTAQVKEVEVKEDTLIFNAGAFKVPEGSVLEDLIKKLPGVEIADGVIKVNSLATIRTCR